MKKKGFTLIELLVVIAIIGVLAGIVLVSLGGVRARARDATRQAEIRQINMAMELKYNDLGAYPAVGAPVGGGRITTAPDLRPYLTPLPTDPGGGANPCNNRVDANYCAFNTPQGPRYCIWAALEDGRFFVTTERGIKSRASVPTGLGDGCW